MNAARIAIFQKALDEVLELRVRSPEFSIAQSMELQLRYLIDVESGRNPDRSRLKDIILGVLAAKEFETHPLAETLFPAAAEADAMLHGR